MLSAIREFYGKEFAEEVADVLRICRQTNKGDIVLHIDGENVDYMGSIITNHHMCLDEILYLCDIKLDVFAFEHGYESVDVTNIYVFDRKEVQAL